MVAAELLANRKEEDERQASWLDLFVLRIACVVFCNAIVFIVFIHEDELALGRTSLRVPPGVTGIHPRFHDHYVHSGTVRTVSHEECL